VVAVGEVGAADQALEQHVTHQCKPRRMVETAVPASHCRLAFVPATVLGMITKQASAKKAVTMKLPLISAPTPAWSCSHPPARHSRESWSAFRNRWSSQPQSNFPDGTP